MFMCHRLPSLERLLRIVAAVAALACASLAAAQTFTNPVFTSQDPWVTCVGGVYYYSESEGWTVYVRKAGSLSGLAAAKPVAVWTAPATGPNSQYVWAPELHFVNGRWYIYYTADQGDDVSHRLFVLQATTSDPQGAFATADTGAPYGQLVTPDDNQAIDPDVFTGPDGKLYLVWSSVTTPGGINDSIRISQMADPLHLTGPAPVISTASEAWETRTASVEEGPVGYTRKGHAYITYSASASWTTDYSVGLLSNPTGDMLNPAAWIKTGPILDHHGTAYGPGSVVFVPSPDGTEWWAVYHGIDTLTISPSYDDRDIRMQKMTWDVDDTPLLGYPANPGLALRLPSGDEGRYGWGPAFGSAAYGGAWLALSSSTLALRGQAGTAWQRAFRGDPGAADYRFQANVQWTGRSFGGTVEYGLYGAYVDESNHVEALIDPVRKLLGVHAVIGGVDQGWQNAALPAGFNVRLAHTLAVTRLADDFTFSIDGAALSHATFALGGAQVGVLSENTLVSYTNVSQDDLSFGWGDAASDAAEGVRTSPQLGAWTLNGAGAADLSSFGGTTWTQLFRGNPNRENFTVSADLRWTGTGTTSSFPKYGLYACYDDADNHAEVFIDRQYQVLATHAVVAGADQGWQNAALPAGFDPTVYHTVKVVKNGSSFSFYLDGALLQQRTFALLNGQIGLVTEDTTANYANVAVTQP